MSKLRTIKVVYDQNPVTGEMIPWLIRVVTKGDHYGRYNGTLVHMSDDPLVEFYDARHDHGNLGQFVSRYYLSTLLDGGNTTHLNLDGGIDSWTVSKHSMDKILIWVARDTIEKIGSSETHEVIPHVRKGEPNVEK